MGIVALKRPDAYQLMRMAYKAKIANETKKLNAQRNKLDAERTEIHNRLDATYDAAMVTGLTPKVVVEQRRKLCARIDDIDQTLASIPTVRLAAEAFADAPIDTATFVSELLPGRNYRNCSASLAVLVQTFRRLVGRVIVTTNKEAARITVELAGPIADIKGKVALELVRPLRSAERIRVSRAVARAGTLSLTDTDWERLREKLPCEEIWMEHLDTPLRMRGIVNAVVFLKHTRVGVSNLPEDVFGPPRQVWSAAHKLSYYGILDIIEQEMIKAGIGLIRGIRLWLKADRSRSRDSINKFLALNDHYRHQVTAR